MNENLIDNLFIFTSIKYGKDKTSEIRSDLFLKTLENAKKINAHVVIENSGAPNELVEKINKFENTTIINKPINDIKESMGESRRKALKKTLELAKKNNIDNPILLWTEPEKEGLISEENIKKMISKITDGNNIVIPERSKKTWDQMPKIQNFLENRANKKILGVINEISNNKFDKELDLWFGPKMFDKEGAKYFINYNNEKNKNDLWDATIVPVIDAIKENKNITGIQVNFNYDKNEIDNELNERDIAKKRLEQYTQILKDVGDKTWVEYFYSIQNELTELKKIRLENNIYDETNKSQNEIKKNVINKFFK